MSDADDFDLSDSTVSDYVADAEAKLDTARRTLDVLDDIRHQAPGRRHARGLAGPD